MARFYLDERLVGNRRRGPAHAWRAGNGLLLGRCSRHPVRIGLDLHEVAGPIHLNGRGRRCEIGALRLDNERRLGDGRLLDDGRRRADEHRLADRHRRADGSGTLRFLMDELGLGRCAYFRRGRFITPRGKLDVSCRRYRGLLELSDFRWRSRFRWR